MAERVEAVVLGAGVVGLAVARALAQAGHEVLVLEAASAIGTVTSSRNSEVVHAGIYYPAGSLKARLCVAGRQALYAYCAEHGVPFAKLGKLIVATSPDEVATLGTIAQRAAANGVALQPIGRDAVRDLEPELAVEAALLSPQTGIVDSHALMLALQGDVETAGGFVAFNAPLLGGAVRQDGFELQVGGAAPMTLGCPILINCAGLQAPAMARQIAGIPASAIPADYLCKGSYYSLTGKNPFKRLIYPVPEPGGLGVHLTIDLGGQARFGPDVQWIDSEDYSVDVSRAEGFYQAIRRYWPGLADGKLVAGYAGIRPKISGPGEAAADFVISTPGIHGIAGLVNLFGIESPGLTAALAISAEVADALAAL